MKLTKPAVRAHDLHMRLFFEQKHLREEAEEALNDPAIVSHLPESKIADLRRIANKQGGMYGV